MIRFVKSCVRRVALWRLHRKLDELEERFVAVSADVYRRQVRR